MRDLRNQKTETKERFRELIIEETGDKRLADRIYSIMAANEIDRKIEASGNG